MPMIKIDNIEYDSEQLNDAAKAQLQMLMLTDKKIQELQQEVMMLQTARNAYVQALKASLPSPLEQVQQSDAIKL